MEQLYSQYAGAIQEYLTNTFKGQLDAGEIDAIVVQTIERIWNKGGTLTAQTDAGARAWVLKISKRKSIDWLRRRVKDQGLDSDLDDERTDLPYRQPQFEEVPFERQNFYPQLSAREREVAERLAQGYRDVDIAQELALSKTRVHQLKQQIAEKLKQFLSAE